MKKIKQRLKSRGGFSLVELLLTTIILLLAASIVARGVPAANLVYRETVDKANAQVLLSTAMTVLRDDVGFATALSIEN
ncbi:MAG: prepilin-type N-terminal cleavage/methylation domain-containing protein, partial [Lachnospiraceae bacterium]|nr:prepilin-type N-terminal cleavage/methylation domain-containing protein [Lachnospiraceae bacterium]